MASAIELLMLNNATSSSSILEQLHENGPLEQLRLNGICPRCPSEYILKYKKEYHIMHSTERICYLYSCKKTYDIECTKDGELSIPSYLNLVYKFRVADSHVKGVQIFKSSQVVIPVSNSGYLTWNLDNDGNLLPDSRKGHTYDEYKNIVVKSKWSLGDMCRTAPSYRAVTQIALKSDMNHM